MESFKSKVDWWLGLILLLVPMVSIGVFILLLVNGAEAAWIGGLPAVFVLLIYGGLVFPMRYLLMEDHLLIRHGLARQRIPYGDIECVKPSGNLLSSPALSLDRLQIDVKGSTFGQRISPVDRDAFLTALGAKTPGLERRGDSLVGGQVRRQSRRFHRGVARLVRPRETPAPLTNSVSKTGQSSL